MNTASIEAAFPLTPLQEGMLYHSIRSPAAGVFVVQLSALLDGPLDVAAFARAWECAAARHAAFRTFFAWEGRERPLQVVRAQVTFDASNDDWRTLDADAQAAQWTALLQDDRARGFALQQAPLMRVQVARVAEHRHRLLWTMHHAMMDGWSALVVLDEVMRDYATIVAGGAPDGTVAARFDEFVGWLEGHDRVQDEAFWRRTLDGVAGTVPLPGAELSARETGERSHATLVLSPDATRQLQATAARLRVTVNTLLMGAWALLLSRHADRDDVLFGVTVSERPAAIAGVDRAAGLYLATVPLRVQMRANDSVGDWLRQVQRALSDARAHGAPGLGAIQRWRADLSASPLFRSLVVFENFAEDAMRPFVAGNEVAAPASDTLVISSASIDVPNDVPLVLLALPGDRMTLDVIHDPGVVPTSIAERLPAQLAELLSAFAGDPDGALDSLTLLGAHERAQITETLSGANVPVPATDDVLSRFLRHVAERPDAVAIVTERTSVTYRELDSHANRLGHRLADAGVTEGMVLGIIADRSIAAIAAMLAALKLGAAYAPLDPATPSARLQRMTRQLDLLIVPAAHAGPVPGDTRTVLLDDAASLPDGPPAHAGNIASTAYVIFTSGSTGEPKGVVVERGQLAASTAARDVYYPESPSAFLLLSSLAVDSSIAGIYWTLCTGGTLVLPASRAEQDIDGLTRLAEQTGVTHTLLVPSLYRTLLEHAELARLASLRYVIVAGEACPAEVVRLHHARLGAVALHNEYGPSEATVWATAGELSKSEGASGQRVTIGQPVLGAIVYVLDSRRRPLPAGAVGELCIGGLGVARGYLGQQYDAVRPFVDDPFREGGRMYCTGDRARFRADGRLDYLGRGDEQLKVRGFRVEPAEIERALADHAAVREAAVVLARRVPESRTDALVAALLALPIDDAERLLQDVESETKMDEETDVQVVS